MLSLFVVLTVPHLLFHGIMLYISLIYERCHYQNKGGLPYSFNYSYHNLTSTWSCVPTKGNSDWNKCLVICYKFLILCQLANSVRLTEISDIENNSTYRLAIVATNHDVVILDLNEEQVPYRLLSN